MLGRLPPLGGVQGVAPARDSPRGCNASHQTLRGRPHNQPTTQARHRANGAQETTSQGTMASFSRHHAAVDGALVPLRVGLLTEVALVGLGVQVTSWACQAALAQHVPEPYMVCRQHCSPVVAMRARAVAPSAG